MLRYRIFIEISRLDLVPGSLQCSPNCNGRTCGDDGCGGSVRVISWVFLIVFSVDLVLDLLHVSLDLVVSMDMT